MELFRHLRKLSGRTIRILALTCRGGVIFLTIAFGLLWLRSLKHTDTLYLPAPSTDTAAFSSSSGSIFFQYRTDPGAEFLSVPSFTFIARPYPSVAESMDDMMALPMEPLTMMMLKPQFDHFGVEYWSLPAAGNIDGRTTEPTKAIYRELQIPCWMPFFAFLALVMFIAWRHWPFRRKLTRGLCPTCNYDLRAHAPNANCPECGTPIPSKGTTP